MIKKISITLYAVLFGFFILLSFSHIVQADNDPPVTVTPSTETPFLQKDLQPYKTLVRLPGLPAVIDPSLESSGAGSFTLPSYIRTLVRIAIGIIGILAVAMIVISGVQYMGSGVIGEKKAAKERLWGAVGGLVLAVASVLILRTINPQLINIRIGDGIFLDCIQEKDTAGNKLFFNNYIEKKLVIQKKNTAGQIIYVNSAGATLPNATYYPKYTDIRCEKTVLTANSINIPEDLQISGGNDYLKSTGNYTGGNPNVTANITTYDTLFKSAADEFGVSCIVLKAHAYAESGMNATAQSSVGAKGLMQIMPRTFNDLKNRKPSLAGNLLDPKTNIRVSAFYIQQLQNGEACHSNAHQSCVESPYSKYDTAAYNGGPGINFSGTCGKTKWECKEFYSKNGVNNETIEYVDRVWKNKQVLTTNGWGCD